MQRATRMGTKTKYFAIIMGMTLMVSCDKDHSTFIPTIPEITPITIEPKIVPSPEAGPIVEPTPKPTPTPVIICRDPASNEPVPCR